MIQCRRIISFLVCAAVLFFTGLCNVQAKTVRIGVVYDGMSQNGTRELNLVQQEIMNITRGAHTIVFPEDGKISGNWDLAEIKNGLDALLASKKIDIILAMGVVSSHYACQQKTLSKPVIAADIIDAKTQQLPMDKGGSGRKNLNYINTFSDIDRAFQSFLDIAPFYRVVVLADGFQIRSIPQLRGLERRIANE